MFFVPSRVLRVAATFDERAKRRRDEAGLAAPGGTLHQMQPTRRRRRTRRRDRRVEQLVVVVVVVVVVVLVVLAPSVDVEETAALLFFRIFYALRRERTPLLQNLLGEETPRASLRVVQRRQRRSERERLVTRAFKLQTRLALFFFFFFPRLRVDVGRTKTRPGPEPGPVANVFFVVVVVVVVVVAREAHVRAGASRPEELMQKRRVGARVRRRGDAHLRHDRVQDVRVGDDEKKRPVAHFKKMRGGDHPQRNGVILALRRDVDALFLRAVRAPSRHRRRCRAVLVGVARFRAVPVCDDGQLRLVARAVRADASDGEDGSRPSPLGVFFARGGGGFFFFRSRVFLLSRLYGSHALSFRASELPPLESLDGAKRDPHARMSIIV